MARAANSMGGCQSAPATQVQKKREKLPAHDGAVSAKPKSTPVLADEEEAYAKRLFSACLQRDKWIDALAGSEPWHAERSAALIRASGSTSKPGVKEQFVVHRAAGDTHAIFVATVLSSPHAPSGDVVWQVDAREKTLSDFGEPGYGALLLGGRVPCVLLVEATPEATILYFYSGRICQLRCWRRHGPRKRRTSGEGHLASEQQQQKQQQKKQQLQQREPSPEEARTRGGQRHARRHDDQNARKAKKRRRSGEGRSSGGGGSSGGGSSGGGSSGSGRGRSTTGSRGPVKSGSHAGDEESGHHGATAAGPDVAAWARGKPVAVLLSELSATYGKSLPGLPKCSPRAELHANPTLLRKAYHRALLAVHPDKHVHSPPFQAALAVALFHALSAAHAAAVARESIAHVAC